MILALDWLTVSSLATAGATLVLAFATFGSVRSANRAARAAERSLLAGLRPVLMPSRVDDVPQKVGFSDDRWFLIPGAGAVAEVGEDGSISPPRCGTWAPASRCCTAGVSTWIHSSGQSMPRRSRTFTV